MIIIEKNINQLQDLFLLDDFREMILSQQVEWVIGHDWQEQLNLLIKNRGLIFDTPDNFMWYGSTPDSDEIKKHFQHLFQTNKIFFQQKIHQRTKRTNRHQPLKIWSCTVDSAPIYTRLNNAVMAGFKALGCEVHQSSLQNEKFARHQIKAQFLEYNPGICFLINGPSRAIYDYYGLPHDWAYAVNSHHITWYVDQPNYLASWQHGVDVSYDTVACVDQTYIDYFKNLKPRSQVKLSACATLAREGNFKHDYHFPILYVGSIKDLTPYLNLLSEDALEWINHIVDLKIQDPVIPFQELILNHSPSNNAKQSILQVSKDYTQIEVKGRFQNINLMVEYFLYAVSAFRKRLKMAEALLPFGLYIFGPNDWLKVLPTEYHNRILGMIASQDLPDAYASAQININIHSVQCPTCLNIRDYDVLRSGGFLISDWVDEFNEDYLHPGKHLVKFNNRDELISKIQYYSENIEERKAIVEQGKEHVVNHHTGTNRAKSLMNALKHKGLIDE